MSVERRGSWSSTISERWQCRSTPGPLRRTGSRIRGPERMENDPLEPMQGEIYDLTDMLNSIETCGRTMQAAIEMLHAAPKNMLEKMSGFYPQDGRYGELVLRFAAVQGQLGQRMESSRAHMQALQTLLTKMFEKNVSQCQAFHQRDEAYTTYSHYEKKVEGLRSSLIRNSGNSRLAQKVNRNEQKRTDTYQAFEQISSETEKSASTILSRKLADSGEAIAHVCRYYASMVEFGENVSRELNTLADGFSRSMSSEEMMKRGKEYASKAAERGREFMNQSTAGEYAQQAKEKMSGFASSTRERFSAASASASSSYQSKFGDHDSAAYNLSQTPESDASTASPIGRPSPRGAGPPEMVPETNRHSNDRNYEKSPRALEPDRGGGQSYASDSGGRSGRATPPTATVAWGVSGGSAGAGGAADSWGASQGGGSGAWPTQAIPSWPSSAGGGGGFANAGSGGFGGGASVQSSPWGPPPTSTTPTGAGRVGAAGRGGGAPPSPWGAPVSGPSSSAFGGFDSGSGGDSHGGNPWGSAK